MTVWVSLDDFAAAAEIHRQSAWRACKSGRWQGKRIIVRKANVQAGGNAGFRYEVQLRSLPDYLQDRLKASRSPLDYTSNVPRDRGNSVAPHPMSEAIWWKHQLGPVLATEPGTDARSVAVEELVGQRALDWRSPPRRIRLARTTIYRKLADLESVGLGARPPRSDRGAPKVLISREWDKAVPFDHATRRKIAEGLTQELRGWHAQGMTRHLALLLSAEYLKRATVAHGHRADDAELKRICVVPVRLWSAEASWKQVYNYTHNRDRFDRDLPRVKRTIEGMRPMELVVADVHPIDVNVELPDGRIGHPRLLAFMDVATRRVWVDVLLVDGEGGVRNIDGIKSVAAWMQEPDKGVPELFYCDNGKEYLFADYLDDALKLNSRNRLSDRASHVIHALPYNASAKPIEAVFHRLESDYFRHIQGWHGGKLGSPMRPARGKLPAPYKGGFESFVALVQNFVRVYNAVPQKGQLKGDSPNERFAKLVAGGWAATVLQPTDLLMVFAKVETRTVRQHGVLVDGRAWSCPELDDYFDRTVTVRIPVLGLGFNELWVGNERGEFIGIAKPDTEREYADTRNAQHSADRKRSTSRAIRGRRAALPDMDAAGRLSALAEAFPNAANAPIGTVSVGTAAMAGAIVPSRRSRAQVDDDRIRERNARQQAAIAEIERAMAEGKARGTL